MQAITCERSAFFFSKGSGLAGEQVRAEHFLGIRNEAKGVHAAVEGCACGG